MSFIAWHVCDSANNSFAGTLSRMMYHTSETKALQETTLGERISHEKTPYEIFDIMEERPSTPPISSNLNPARINCATSTIIIANRSVLACNASTLFHNRSPTTPCNYVGKLKLTQQIPHSQIVHHDNARHKILPHCPL